MKAGVIKAGVRVRVGPSEVCVGLSGVCVILSEAKEPKPRSGSFASLRMTHTP
jgi:hypothetical protein